jgi:hypothetical protein
MHSAGELVVVRARDQAMEVKTYLGQLHDNCLEMLDSIKFDKYDSRHFCLMTLYSSLIELVGCIFILLNKNRKIGIRPLFRTFLETYVELQNLMQDPKYMNYIDANYVKEWLKVFIAARDTENPYLAKIAASADLNISIEELEQQLKELKKKGYEPINIYRKFKQADMEEQYRSLYNFLCSDSHSSMRALISRHAEIDNKDYGLVIYKDTPDETFLPVLDSAAELLVFATIRLHELLGSDAFSEAKRLEVGLKEARSIYLNET